ncbi:cysteine synthase family protein [Candidatus Micrarchaeota archaeon]|nr:cysteine synthase family protein [Candidatus Micrarchaeota archaeon]
MHGICKEVGNTPLMELESPEGARIFAKLEYLNPSGSVKDRMAKHMADAAEANDLLGRKRIVEATSGNTGISFAWLSAVRGYEFTAVMPEMATVERRSIMKLYGANLMLVSAVEGYSGAVEKAKAVSEESGAWLPSQYDNVENIRAHEECTGPEILRQLEERKAGELSAFVAGAGTGGTLIGVARAVRKSFSGVKIIGVEPEESPMISEGRKGSHGIGGIGIGFVPGIIAANRSMVSAWKKVSTPQAIAHSRKLAHQGFGAGISAGANYAAALHTAKELGEGVVITVLPDSSDRYYSTTLFPSAAD